MSDKAITPRALAKFFSENTEKDKVINELFDFFKLDCLENLNLSASGTDELIQKFESSPSYNTELLASIIESIRSSQKAAVKREKQLSKEVASTIKESLLEDVSIKDMAKKMNISYYYMCHIFKNKYVEEADGKRTELDEEALAALRAKMQELRDTGMSKDNFESFAELNTDAKDGVTKNIGAGDFPVEIERIVLGLKDGEFSPVLETEEGFYVVKCVLAFDEDATAARKEEMIVERQDAMFATTFQRWKEQAEIIINEEKWAVLQP